MIMPATQAFNLDKTRQTLDQLLQEGERLLPGVFNLIVDPVNKTGLLNDRRLLGQFEQPAHLYLMEYFMLTALEFDPESRKRAFARFRAMTVRQKAMREFEIANGATLDADESWPRETFTQKKMDKIMRPYIEKAFPSGKRKFGRNISFGRIGRLLWGGCNVDSPIPPIDRDQLPDRRGYSNDLL